MSVILDRIKSLGIDLPKTPKPVAAYVPALEVDGLVFISGQLPRDDRGEVITGRLGEDVSTEDAYTAARSCGINIISALLSVCGDLDRVESVVKINGFVNSTPDFTDQAKVVNGCSELMEEVFGAVGKHARAAVGVCALPLNACVEVEAIVKLKRD